MPHAIHLPPSASKGLSEGLCKMPDHAWRPQMSNKCVQLAQHAAAYLQSGKAYILEKYYEGAEQHSCDVSI